MTPRKCEWDSGLVEYDVTPQWWKPTGAREAAIMRSAVFELFFWRWHDETSRLGEDLRGLYRDGLFAPGRGGGLSIGDGPAGRLLVRRRTSSRDVSALCDALLDRLSSPDVARGAIGRATLYTTPGGWSEADSPRAGKIRIKAVAGVDERVVEFTDRMGDTMHLPMMPGDVFATFGVEA